MAKFEDLLGDENYDEGAVVGALAGLVSISRESENVIWKGASSRLTAAQRIVVYLLARIAMESVGVIAEIPAGPKEICGGTGMPGGTVRPRLMELHDQLRIVGREKRKYWIPPHAVPLAVEYIGGE
ncbi:MAG: hypothetical protein KAW89_07930 [Armatimonadetes bacterium]|nr:hypothetical protein [Armatimonadota bacterium]